MRYALRARADFCVKISKIVSDVQNRFHTYSIIRVNLCACVWIEIEMRQAATKNCRGKEKEWNRTFHAAGWFAK